MTLPPRALAHKRSRLRVRALASYATIPVTMIRPAADELPNRGSAPNVPSGRSGPRRWTGSAHRRMELRRWTPIHLRHGADRTASIPSIGRTRRSMVRWSCDGHGVAS
jgi:hypothetical protein